MAWIRLIQKGVVTLARRTERQHKIGESVGLRGFVDDDLVNVSQLEACANELVR